ncbi:hypothetical protein [Legionella antarctica]|uniref:hypothetical protein n=1 Tax=Legionella antarctica TaxID=2708020 RepID=UPI0015673990|nr:hypothetical protein [Legionella antarctica]
MIALRLGSIILGLLIGYTLVNNIEMSNFLMEQVHDYSWAHFLIALFFILNTLSIIGLLLTKIWGFYFAYVAVTFSTIFFSTNYIPFFNHLFNPKFNTHLLLFYNAVFLIALGAFHLGLKFNRETTKP